MKRQSIESQKCEIEFRKKLVKQQVEGEHILSEEPDSIEMTNILGERMVKTLKQMILLHHRGISLSPYVEIGAAGCHRSLVMENELNATGATVDISFDKLKSCIYYKNLFNKKKIPFRICCDINNLPFLTDSVPFVFCYTTLHHFPDPFPVINEIYRILSPGGYLFFDEEPYKRILHLNLYRGEKSYSPKKLKASIIKKILNYFFSFSKRSSRGLEHGIVENEDISFAMWKRALNCFIEKEVTLQAPNGITSELFGPKNYLNFILTYLLGGLIKGICRKSGNYVNKSGSIYQVLACPSCNKNAQASNLIQENTSLVCCRCGKLFPIIEGVAFLFSEQKFKDLYPDIFFNMK